MLNLGVCLWIPEVSRNFVRMFPQPKVPFPYALHDKLVQFTGNKSDALLSSKRQCQVLMRAAF